MKRFIHIAIAIVPYGDESHAERRLLTGALTYAEGSQNKYSGNLFNSNLGLIPIQEATIDEHHVMLILKKPLDEKNRKMLVFKQLHEGIFYSQQVEEIGEDPVQLKCMVTHITSPDNFMASLVPEQIGKMQDIFATKFTDIPHDYIHPEYAFENMKVGIHNALESFMSQYFNTLGQMYMNGYSDRWFRNVLIEEMHIPLDVAMAVADMIVNYGYPLQYSAAAFQKDKAQKALEKS